MNIQGLPEFKNVNEAHDYFLAESMKKSTDSVEKVQKGNFYKLAKWMSAKGWLGPRFVRALFRIDTQRLLTKMQELGGEEKNTHAIQGLGKLLGEWKVTYVQPASKKESVTQGPQLSSTTPVQKGESVPTVPQSSPQVGTGDVFGDMFKLLQRQQREKQRIDLGEQVGATIVAKGQGGPEKANYWLEETEEQGKYLFCMKNEKEIYTVEIEFTEDGKTATKITFKGSETEVERERSQSQDKFKTFLNEMYDILST